MTDEKTPQKTQIIALPEVKPFFSSSAMVRSILSEYKKDERDATIHIIFLYENVAIASVNTTVRHAKALIEALKTQVELSEKFEKTGEKPTQPTEKKTTEPSYIG